MDKVKIGHPTTNSLH